VVAAHPSISPGAQKKQLWSKACGASKKIAVEDHVVGRGVVGPQHRLRHHMARVTSVNVDVRAVFCSLGVQRECTKCRVTGVKKQKAVVRAAMDTGALAVVVSSMTVIQSWFELYAACAWPRQGGRAETAVSAFTRL